MIKISYIWHDCFLVETDEASLVFDFWKDPTMAADSPRGSIPPFVSRLPKEKPLYVFVSHSHKDHFNTDIFSWAPLFADIRYIVSNDVWKRCRHIASETSVYKGTKVAPDRLTRLLNGESYTDARVKVEAYPSTDEGNSYMVTTGGKVIFHAGDLNAWVWKEESTVEEINKAIGDYKACLRSIRERDIDYAFFPVDSRLGKDYFLGAEMFVREFNVGHFFPMHFGLGDPAEQARYQADAVKFTLYANPSRGEYIPLTIPYTYFLGA